MFKDTIMSVMLYTFFDPKAVESPKTKYILVKKAKLYRKEKSFSRIFRSMVI